MPASLSTQEMDDIISRLLMVFRDRGFEGTSLSDLSRATGLGKSSLYHHFPLGKEQMAEAVLERARKVIQAAVDDIARSDEPLRARLRKIVAALEEIYAGGRSPCALGKLATSSIGGSARIVLQQVFALWTDAVAALARDSGMSSVRARQFGQDWVARLQGALILHAANGDTGPFERTLSALLDLAKEKAAATHSIE